MSDKKTRLCVLFIVLVLFSGLLHAGCKTGSGSNPWVRNGQSSWCPPGQNPPSNQRGFSFGPQSSVPGPMTVANRSFSFGPQQRPSYGGQQQGAPWQGNRNPYGSSTSQQKPPRAEAFVSEMSPYVQQGIIYTVRVVSSGNVKTIEPLLPAMDTVAVEKLGDTTARQGRDFVTSFSYALTPLHPGTVNIQPARIKGTYSRGGRSFELTAGQPFTLEVQPANGQVQPWLPLRAFDIRADIEAPQNRQPGDPLTLTVTMSAVGLPGEQLPSLVDRLQSADFKLYQEKTDVTSGASRDGRDLLGQRIERYTLVPQHGGLLRVNEVRIPWWNVNTDAREYAVLQSKSLRVTGPGWLSTASANALMIDYWQVLAGAAGAMLAYWLFVWLRNIGAWRRLGRAIAAAWAPVSAALREQLGWLLAKVSPPKYYRRIRHRVIMALPLAYKVRYCLRQLDGEEDPAEWSQLFQLFISKWVHLPVHTPVSKISEALVEHNATTKPDELMAMMAELDATLYGAAAIDFKTWKRRLYRVVRPRLFGRTRRTSARPRATLPSLNPTH